MKKALLILIAFWFTDFCLFPISLNAMPGANFKTVLAAMGLMLAFGEMFFKRKTEISSFFGGVTVYAGLISLIAYLATVWNNTTEYTLATYIVSAWVWFFAAYMAVRAIRHAHGYVSLRLLTVYLVAVSVMQCLSAVMIDTIPPFAAFVNRVIFNPDAGRMMMAHRLYGIGASLDIAGIRFSCVLVMLVHLLLMHQQEMKTVQVVMAWISFLFIVLVGSMISRTTALGALIAVGYYGVHTFFHSGFHGVSYRVFRAIMLLLMLIATALCIVAFLYTTDMTFRNHLEFGFEGFFNMYESGTFETTSTDILQSMVVLPDNIKTWLIGDGLFFEGDHFYKWTDIGYLRFIFYFGCIGLSVFILMYVYMARTLSVLLPKDRALFWLLLCINMIVWFKVATDTFVIFMFVTAMAIISRRKTII